MSDATAPAAPAKRSFGQLVMDTFTGADNRTLDLGRIMWVKMGIAYVGMSAWAVTHGAAFDPITWGTGAGAVLAAGGAALAIKANTEPKP